jgi:Ser/Thr protein kinase RdoA (MazF antagonist)
VAEVAPPHPEPRPVGTKSRVEAAIAGYSRHTRLTAAKLDHLPHAVRFRPLVIAAREFADSVDEDRASNSGGWWVHYADADTVAAHAQQVLLERYPQITGRRDARFSAR